MERQDEDTFNRFDVFDELGQQEVNTRLNNVEQLVADSRLEICSSIPSSISHVESVMPMVMEGKIGTQMILEPNVDLGQEVEDAALPAKTAASNTDK